jgi:uncharacterized membrane protein YgcG
MRRALTSALVAAALVALPLAGCGDKPPGVSKKDANELVRLLRKAQTASDNPGKHCDTLLAAVAKLNERVAALPSKVDKDVRDSLQNGVKNLSDQSNSLCSKQKTPTTTTTTPTTTVPTTPPPTTRTIPPPTQHTTPPPTQEPPPTTPPQTTPGNGGGGTAPGSGNGNGNGSGNGGGSGNGSGGGSGNGQGSGGIGPQG